MSNNVIISKSNYIMIGGTCMTKANVLRLMEDKDLPYVPKVREKFEKYGHHGSYFFFVIEDDNEEIIGYLVAEKEDTKAVIKELELPKTFEKREEYRSTAISNLYDYVQKIKGSEGKRCFFQVCFI